MGVEHPLTPHRPETYRHARFSITAFSFVFLENVNSTGNACAV